MTCPLCGLPLDPFRNTIVRLMDQPPYHATCPEPNSGESQEPSSSSSKPTAPRKDPTVSSPDPLCEDCESPMSEHTGPGGANPWTACKAYIPRGPKC